MPSKLPTIIVVIICAIAAPAVADPLRLRGDALLDARSPSGLLVLDASDKSRPWMRAEALVWSRADDSGDMETTANALVIALRLRDPGGRGELRLGRMVLAVGGVRPVHVDGASGRASLNHGFEVEAFGGVPVSSELGDRSLDWLAGARVANVRKGFGVLGLTYLQQRDDSMAAYELVGADASMTPTGWLDLAARASYDLLGSAVSDARLSVAAQRRGLRGEVFATRRSPASLLPATSLFAVLGDIASTDLGTAALWRAAPRLDLRGSIAYRSIGGEPGAEFQLRSSLRLDDRGKGLLTLELRRQQAPAASWSGARVSLRVPIRPRLMASSEVELVVPDNSQDRGAVWPWALAALTWKTQRGWEAAAAIEARSSPEFRREMTALLRLTRAWGKP